jgi:hypothetical protein
VCAAANTYGTGADALYVGRNQLDAATLDRFYVVEMDYDRKLEAKLAPEEVVHLGMAAAREGGRRETSARGQHAHDSARRRPRCAPGSMKRRRRTRWQAGRATNWRR